MNRTNRTGLLALALGGSVFLAGGAVVGVLVVKQRAKSPAARMPAGEEGYLFVNSAGESAWVRPDNVIGCEPFPSDADLLNIHFLGGRDPKVDALGMDCWVVPVFRANGAFDDPDALRERYLSRPSYRQLWDANNQNNNLIAGGGVERQPYPR